VVVVDVLVVDVVIVVVVDVVVVVVVGGETRARSARRCCRRRDGTDGVRRCASHRFTISSGMRMRGTARRRIERIASVTLFDGKAGAGVGRAIVAEPGPAKKI
jgi:hypothetical protein